MSAICEADVKALLGETDAHVLRELIRTKATNAELVRAIELASNPAACDINAYRRLPSRVQRLADLLSVTGLAAGENRTRAA